MRVLLLFVAALSLLGCGVSTKDGSCKDYVPAMSCPAGSDYICETNKDGCKQCTCVPNRDHPESSSFE